MNCKIRLSILTLFSLGLSGYAQDAAVASGGDALGTGGAVNYSVGQPLYMTTTGTNASVSEGVQQPYEISVVSGLEEYGILLNSVIYPNPTSNLLNLNIEKDNLEGLSYQLYTINGALLESKKITNTETLISVGSFPNATYFLKITTGNGKELKAFKLVKN